MPEQAAERRRRNFEEVNQGLTVLGATTEAMRCLQCTTPKCMAGCPVGVKVKDFVELDRRGRLPGGRGQDPRGQRPAGHHRPRLPAGDPVRGLLHPGQQVRAAGHRLPRAVRGRLRARARARSGCPEIAPPTGKKVAIVGSGPAGLSAAGDLVRQGHAGHRLRGPARDRRRADLRHPRVPPAQGDRPPRGRRDAARWASTSRPTSSSARP